MIKVTVIINGREYNLKGKEDENYLKEVSEFVNSKIKEITSKNTFLSTGDAAVLAAINIADELYKGDIEVDRLNKIKISLEERNQTLSDTIKELRERIEKIHGTSNKAIGDLENKIRNLNGNTLEITNKNKGLIEENNRLDSNNKNLQNEVENLKKELSEVNNLSELLNKKVVNIKEKNTLLQEKIQEASYAENAIKKELTFALNEKEQIKKILDEGKYSESVLKNEIESIKKENKELNEEIKRSINSKESQQEELDIMKERNDELKDEVNNLNGSIIELKGKIEEKNKELEIEKSLKNSMEEDFKIKGISEKEILKEEIKGKKNIISELEEKVERLAYEKTKILDSGKESRNDLKTAKYRILDLEKKLLDVQIEMARMKKDKNPLIK
jgi:cell division protein ZapA